MTATQRDKALEISNSLLDVGLGADRLDFIKNIEYSFDAFINQIYPPTIFENTDTDHLFSTFSTTSILAPTNTAVDDINNVLLGKLTTECYRSISTDVPVDESLISHQEVLASISRYHDPRIPPHVLELKVGAPMILANNVLASAGLVNGLRLIVTEIAPTLVTGKILSGDRAGEEIHLTKIRFKYDGSKREFPYEFLRIQFPLRLCFAMTTNKSQGQTFKGKVGIDLQTPCFFRGQLYVAISRLTNMNNAVLRLPPDDRPNETSMRPSS